MIECYRIKNIELEKVGTFSLWKNLLVVKLLKKHCNEFSKIYPAILSEGGIFGIHFYELENMEADIDANYEIYKLEYGDVESTKKIIAKIRNDIAGKDYILYYCY